MKIIALIYPLLFLTPFLANAETASEYDVLYGKCLSNSGPINNGVVAACSEKVSSRAKSEINLRYKSIYARLLGESSEDAKKFDASQKSWLLYRNHHCELAGYYIGSPMYGYCPMKLNAARALELRVLDGE